MSKNQKIKRQICSYIATKAHKYENLLKNILKRKTDVRKLSVNVLLGFQTKNSIVL